MDLRKYLKSLSEEDRVLFAERCETTVNYMWRLARGAKRGMEPSPRLAAKIERFSNKKVRRWESIPKDWHEIWPELVRAAGAPRVEANRGETVREGVSP